MSLISFVYRDPFHSAFVGTTTSLSLISNGLLIFIICTTHSPNLGPYRVLLGIFAVCNISTSLMHALIQPIMHLTSSGFYSMPRRAGQMMIFGVSLDTTVIMMFIATYYQTFLVLSFHFVYRFKKVTGWLRGSFTDSWAIKHWAVVGFSIYVIYISTFVCVCSAAFLPDDWTRANVPSEVIELYGIDLHNRNAGYTTIFTRRKCSSLSEELCWHWPTVLAVIGLMSMFFATASVIVFCIYKTRAAIKSTASTLTPKTRKMQQTLFKALLIQTAVPSLFSYTPLAIMILFPICTGIVLGDVGNFLFSITAIFPAIDSFFVLYFIPRFRLAVCRLFRLPSQLTSDVSSMDQNNSNMKNNSTVSKTVSRRSPSNSLALM